MRRAVVLLATIGWVGASLTAWAGAPGDGAQQGAERGFELGSPPEEAVDLERRTTIPYAIGSGERLVPMEVEPLHEPEPEPEVVAAPNCGNVAGGWTLEAGQGLREVLEGWGDCAEWRVRWNSEFRFTVMADAVVGGDFVEAASTVIDAFRQADPPLFAHFYKANRVLVVSTPAELSNR